MSRKSPNMCLADLSSMNFKSTEARELQDMYRRTLAASFAAQAGELPADECIESIFAGGDGWRDKHQVNTMPVSSGHRRGGGGSIDSSHRRRHSRDVSPASPFLNSSHSTQHLHPQYQSQHHHAHQQQTHERHDSRDSLGGTLHRRKNGSSNSLSSVASMAMHQQDEAVGGSRAGVSTPLDLGPGEHRHGQKAGLCELDELNIREDLRSWTLPLSS